MRYWWVNHSKKGPTEVEEGYLWSPKHGAKGAQIQFYENMRRAKIGEAVFSCVNGQIAHVGRITSPAQTAAKPDGYMDEVWDQDGWNLSVEWEALPQPVRPGEIISELRPSLPNSHSPIRENGRLNQVYLTEISREMFDIIMRTAEGETTKAWQAVMRARRRSRGPQGRPEKRTPPETERIKSGKIRIGQGLFRIRIRQFGEERCRITGIRNPRLLVASHIKPWRDCCSAERLDGANGFLLTPDVDRLFDRGLISFENDGRVKVSRTVTDQDLQRLGLNGLRKRNIGPVAEEQMVYLGYHRKHIFRKK
ncbi:MAG TPA: HNH endonuclease signature motif containing protein [Allosphingosinicella sp.]